MGYLCFNCATRFPTQEHLDDHNCEKTLNKWEREKSADDNLCQTCGKKFASAFSLRRHQKNCKTEKESERKFCKVFRKSFSNYRNRYKHEKNCKVDSLKVSDPLPCVPESSTSSVNVPSGCVKCRKCDFKCSTASDLYVHRMLQHSQVDPSSYQPQLYGDGEIPPWENEDGVVDDRLRSVYNQHKHLILKQKVIKQTAFTRYNFPVSNNVSMDDFKNQIEEMYENSSNAFKINLSFGIMLRHTETGKYRYFTGMTKYRKQVVSVKTTFSYENNFLQAQFKRYNNKTSRKRFRLIKYIY